MKKVTKIDFEKLRQLIMYFKAPNNVHSAPSDVINASLQRLYDETQPTMAYLINYYYEKMDESGEEVTNNPFSGMTKKGAVLYALNMGYRKLDSFLKSYGEIFESAMQHYEEASAKKLEEVLKQNLGNMTGEQFILLLQEYDKRKASL